MSPEEVKPSRRRQWLRKARLWFRGFRIVIWLLILVLVVGVLYVNQVGLPGFLKRSLLAELQERGIDLQFQRLRWRWHEGIVAEGVRFGEPGHDGLPQVQADQVQVQLNARQLARLKLQVDGLKLRQGKVVWNVAATNQPQRELVIDNIQTDLRLMPGDEWRLDNLRADFAGAHLRLEGRLANASAVSEWGSPERRSAPDRGKLQRQLTQLAETLDRIDFPSPPDLHLSVEGDAKDLQSFTARLLIRAPGAKTAWGDFRDARFAARLYPATNSELSRAQGTLEAADAHTPWAEISDFHLKFDLLSLEGQRVHGDAQLSARKVKTRWASGDDARISANWIHALTNPVPLSGRGSVECRDLTSKWARAGTFAFTGDWRATPEAREIPRDPAFGFWTNVQPFDVDWQCRVEDLRTEKVSAEMATAEGHWHTPLLQITNLEARLYGGKLVGESTLDVQTRQANARVALDADAQELKTLLTAGAQRWLNQFAWTNAPSARATAQVVLPSWTNSQPDWRQEVLPTLTIDGQFNAPRGGSYRGAHVTAASGHFRYDDMVWHLPDLHIVRPEGSLTAAHIASDLTKDYYWKLHGALDPAALRPLLGTNEQHVLDLFEFTGPPSVSGEVWGRYRDYTRTGARLEVAATNFVFRNQKITAVAASLDFTNSVLAVSHPYLQQGERFAYATNLVFYFDQEIAVLSNAWSNVDPMLIANIIGPHTARTLQPYKFDSPPTGTAHGIIPLRGEEKADIYFELEGGPFHWWRFNVPLISGSIHWQGTNLHLANIRSDFYGGRAFCSADISFQPGGNAIYSYNAWTTNVLLQFLAKDLWPHLTNRLEGYLSGSLVVTRADASDPKVLDGYGAIRLRDGLLWDIPIFGVFSTVLNSVSPGLGNNRASEGVGTFTITNAVIFSDDMDIRSTGMRLAYRGTVDLEGAVNARVEASILRDTWLIGSVVSTVLWPVSKIFEYRVTGTLSDPNLEPVYLLPKLLSLPFLPFKALKGKPEPAGTFSTNAPPVEAPPSSP